MCVSRGLYFACMKKSTTSVALKTAIPSATTVFHGPRSTPEIAVVAAVMTSRVTKIAT